MRTMSTVRYSRYYGRRLRAPRTELHGPTLTSLWLVSGIAGYLSVNEEIMPCDMAYGFGEPVYTRALAELPNLLLLSCRWQRRPLAMCWWRKQGLYNYG